MLVLAEILEMIQLIFQAVTRTAANEESEVMLLSWDKCTSLTPETPYLYNNCPNLLAFLAPRMEEAKLSSFCTGLIRYIIKLSSQYLIQECRGGVSNLLVYWWLHRLHIYPNSNIKIQISQTFQVTVLLRFYILMQTICDHIQSEH